MPISAENRARYPANWKAIRARIQARAGDKCEQCAVPNGAYRIRGREQFTFDLMQVEAWTCCDELKVSKIVCTTAHLDHQPENCADENLKFLCQRCHLSYDAEHHQQSAYKSRRKGRAADMFEVSA